jgi:hypothetical protein
MASAALSQQGEGEFSHYALHFCVFLLACRLVDQALRRGASNEERFGLYVVALTDREKLRLCQYAARPNVPFGSRANIVVAGRDRKPSSGCATGGVD